MEILRLWMKLSTGGNQWFSTVAWALDFLSEVPSSREATHPCLTGPGFKFGNQKTRRPTPMLVAPKLRNCRFNTQASRFDAFSGRRLIILPRILIEPHPDLKCGFSVDGPCVHQLPSLIKKV